MYLNFNEAEQVIDWLNYILSFGNVDNTDVFYSNSMLGVKKTPSQDLFELIKTLERKLEDDATG